MELTPPENNRKPGRLLGADLARVVMILLMIQGHTLDALWTPMQHRGAAFEFWLSVRGLTAPAFLLLSGFSFTLASRRMWEGDGEGGGLQRRINRFLLLIFLGYTMHLPARTFDGLMAVDAQGWRNFLQVDILQCIGVSLLLMQMLMWLTKTPGRFAFSSFGIGVGFALAAPMIWDLPSGIVPTVFASYLNGANSSQFPLFPWAGYLFIGAAMGYLFLKRSPEWLAPRFAIVGTALIAIGMTLSRSSLVFYSGENFWKTGPSLFVTRLGWVLAILAAGTLVAPLLKPQARWIQALAKESLVIYYVHLCILYGSVWNMGLRQYVGPSLTFWDAASCAVTLVVCMIGMALGWSWMKKTWRSQPAWLKASYWFPSS